MSSTPAPHVHTVYFSLEDHSEASRNSLIALIKRLLPGHPGELYFTVGPRSSAVERNVSDLAFDVAMTIIFASTELHDSYQTSARHDQFRDELSRLPVSVRVFDSLIA